MQSALRARELALRGEKIFDAGDYQSAHDLFTQAVELMPREPAYHYRLASAAWRLGRHDSVERHYRLTAELNPDHPEPYKALAQWYLQRGRLSDALASAERSMTLSPGDVDAQVTYAVILHTAGQALEAWKIIEPLVNSGSTVWHLATAYARVAPRIGHERQALALLDRAGAEPGLADSHRSTLHFATAALLDHLGEYDAAFEQARRGNLLSGRTFDSAAYSQWTLWNIDYFSPRRMNALPRATHGSSRPVFIIGMPRSGTSLVEQILASHPDVAGGGELQLLPEIVASLANPRWAGGAGYPACLDRLSIEVANQIAAGYLRGIDAIDSAARYVTDKLPTNFESLWLAEVLFPECRIIHCLRDPRDVGISCYFTHFAEGNGFTYDLGNLASYFRDYQKLTAHWKQVVGLPMLEVRYEEVVADLEGQTRRMLSFLDLPWDQNCLDFHGNKRYVATASFEQVRRPLYASSVGRWRHYQRHIPQLADLASFDVK